MVSNLDIIFPMIYYNITRFCKGKKLLLQEGNNIDRKKVSARDCLFKRDEGSFKKSMEIIEQYCREHGLQLTPVRKKVFEFLLDEPRGLGAYKILDLLRYPGLITTTRCVSCIGLSCRKWLCTQSRKSKFVCSMYKARVSSFTSIYDL